MVRQDAADGPARAWQETAANEWIYFVAPPWGWGPEAAYNLGEIEGGAADVDTCPGLRPGSAWSG